MKEEILDITKKLYHNHLTPETATNLLLDLFAVSGRSELLVCGNCLNNHTNKKYEGYCSQSCFDGIK